MGRWHENYNHTANHNVMTKKIIIKLCIVMNEWKDENRKIKKKKRNSQQQQSIALKYVFSSIMTMIFWP